MTVTTERRMGENNWIRKNTFSILPLNGKNHLKVLKFDNTPKTWKQHRLIMTCILMGISLIRVSKFYTNDKIIILQLWFCPNREQKPVPHIAALTPVIVALFFLYYTESRNKFCLLMFFVLRLQKGFRKKWLSAHADIIPVSVSMFSQLCILSSSNTPKVGNPFSYSMVNH